MFIIMHYQTLNISHDLFHKFDLFSHIWVGNLFIEWLHEQKKLYQTFWSDYGAISVSGKIHLKFSCVCLFVVVFICLFVVIVFVCFVVVLFVCVLFCYLFSLFFLIRTLCLYFYPPLFCIRFVQRENITNDSCPLFIRPIFKIMFIFCIRVNVYGALNLQAPFGGYKQSGIGREG